MRHRRAPGPAQGTRPGHILFGSGTTPADRSTRPPAIDPQLWAASADVERQLLEAAETYLRAGDFRWLFTYTHGRITRRINKHLALFKKPNLLLAFNRQFAEAYLRAIAGKPHDRWKKAFAFCKVLEEADAVPPPPWMTNDASPGVPFALEMCAKEMAETHISIDIKDAIDAVGCIPPTDYGNMWHLVKLSTDEALARYRGEFLARYERWVEKKLLGELVRQWRNAVYTASCRLAVPDVESDFVRRYESTDPADRRPFP